MNGVKNKFLQDDVRHTIETYDIVIISETHFAVRIKCPEDFMYIGRSKEIKSKRARGGVALFKKKNSDLQMEIVCDSFRDCVICRICNTDI